MRKKCKELLKIAKFMRMKKKIKMMMRTWKRMMKMKIRKKMKMRMIMNKKIMKMKMRIWMMRAHKMINKRKRKVVNNH